MKRLFVSFTLILFLVANTSFARASDVITVLQTFYQSFSGAKNVSISEVNGMTCVSFTMDDELNYAYYNSSAELVVMSKQISFKNLPRTLQADYKYKYANYFIADVLQFTNDDGTAYYIVLEDQTRRMVMSSSTNKWKTFRLEEKK